MFPIYHFVEGFIPPEEGTYYLVAGNGIWLHKDTGIVTAFHPVQGIGFLEDVEGEPRVGCNLPKIPGTIVAQLRNFFQDVVELRRCEAMALLYFNKAEQKFMVIIPPQTVGYASAGYAMLPSIGDYLRVGTIHSHCNFGAGHSGVDVHDEESFDGLHCTFGNNDLEEITVVASIVVNGYRMPVDPLSVLDGIEKQNGDYVVNSSIDGKYDDAWMDRIH